MGFGYSDWEGVFYPPGLPARNYLRHYSRFFNSVELDTTFYGPPRPDQVLRWRQSVPDNFRFSVKTPRQITHEHRLIRAQGLMDEFLSMLELFSDQLGAVLIQLPPDYTFREKDALLIFLANLPEQFRFAVEFRHQSWYQAETAELLAKHNIGWASTEYLDLPIVVHLTGNFIYIRWIGEHGKYDRKDHERVDFTVQLQNWLSWIKPHIDIVNSIFGYFNNDYAGFSPATCNRFKKLAGLPVDNFEPPKQPRLF